MALLVYDGFDHYAGIADMHQRAGFLQYTGFTLMNFIPGGGRAGYGNCIQFGTSIFGNPGQLNASLSYGLSQITFGFAVNFASSPVTEFDVKFIDSYTGTVQCRWNLNAASGQISFYGASGALVQTALNAIYPNGWMYVELQNLISSSNGTAKVRVNGNPLPSFPDITTGLNTQASGNASVSCITLFGPASTGSGVYFDDFYIADGTTGPGSYPNNGFIGDVRVATLFPISNNSVQWTPAANSNWQEVAETSFDGDASYNYTATAGAQDSFNFGSLDVDTNQVIGLQVTVAVRKQDAGARTIAPVLVIGGTTYVGTPVSMDVSYLYITSIWPVNPATNASWTVAAVNALIAGYQVVT